MTREEYIREYDAINSVDTDDSGSISMYIMRANAGNLRIAVCQKYIKSLEARVAELDNELSALRTKWDELPAFLVKQDEADIFDEHNLNMLLIEYILDIKPEEK